MSRPLRNTLLMIVAGFLCYFAGIGFVVAGPAEWMAAWIPLYAVALTLFVVAIFRSAHGMRRG